MYSLADDFAHRFYPVLRRIVLDPDEVCLFQGERVETELLPGFRELFATLRQDVLAIAVNQVTRYAKGHRPGTGPGRGVPEDYIRSHDWFDESKKIIADSQHRALRHHAEGIFMAETIFGSTITLSTGRVIPTRWISEQHVREDLGFIPSFADWAREVRPKPWMGRTQLIDEGEAMCEEPAKGVRTQQ